jgi:N,N'-diacetylchitobiose phosphorylase
MLHISSVEGDVLHWWHPAPLERGLRTRFADDLLWLPFVTAHYVRVTGDVAVLDEPSALSDRARWSRGRMKPICARVQRRIRRSLRPLLPRPGPLADPWRARPAADGNRRLERRHEPGGREGRGESVWMGFFLYRVLGDFLPLCEARGDQARVESYRAVCRDLERALEAGGWDGDWYRRAYYDDGTPLGSARTRMPDRRLAQSWAATLRRGPARTRRAGAGCAGAASGR